MELVEFQKSKMKSVTRIPSGSSAREDSQQYKMGLERVTLYPGETEPRDAKSIKILKI